jgi:hypothetical protein
MRLKYSDVKKPLVTLGTCCLTILFALFTDGQTSVREIGPDANFCAEVNDLTPGEVLELLPGDYRGPCRIHRDGRAGAPITVQGKSVNEKPRVIYDGHGSNVIEINADYVTVRGLKLGPTKRHVDGVRIVAARGITIEDCEFSNLGGIAIAATRTSVDGLIVRRNVVTDSAATAMYFGCHDGIGCQISNLVIERNFIKGVDAADPEIGYGMQIKLNSVGSILDNVIADTKGPAIMVYGSLDDGRRSVIERNFVTGSRQSSGILIGGGPALARNNIAAHNFAGGIRLQDYGNRGLLRKIIVVNNTSYRNGKDEFVVPADVKVSQTLFALNAATTTEGGQAFPKRRSGLDLRQNVACTLKRCFSDASSLNFSPVTASVISSVRRVDDAQTPQDDYFGRSRIGRLTAGAIGIPGPSIRLGIKSEH